MIRLNTILRALLLFMITTGGAGQVYSHTVRVHIAEDIPKDQKVLHGVCRQNLQWVKNQSTIENIADNIALSEIPLVRLSAVKERGSIDQVIQNIQTFSRRNIHVLLVQPLFRDFFTEGYQLVPGPNYKLYKMSDIDMNRFSKFMDNFFRALSTQIEPGVLVGFELFNEVNWGDFNGDLQPRLDGKGQVFTLNVPLDTPAFRDVYAGIMKYGKCLEVTREKLDKYFPGGNVKLITHGLVVGNPHNNYRWMINHGFSFVAPDMFLTILQGQHPEQEGKTNYLKLADAIGIHFYPSLVDDLEEVLIRDYFDPITSILQEQMPFWITEWGFSRKQFEDNGGEKKRLQYMQCFVQAVERMKNVETTTLYEFDATNDHNIWENGALLKSGEIFENIN